jgi:TatD DNase family protein
LGEIGLDYHYERSPRADQHRAFAAQLNLARE